MLSGYIGHNVSDREKINARLTFAQRLTERREKGADKVALDVSISSTDFEKFINSWLDYHYDHTEHSELKCTPFEQFTQHQQTIKRLDNERLLTFYLHRYPAKKDLEPLVKKVSALRVLSTFTRNLALTLVSVFTAALTPMILAKFMFSTR